MTLFVDNFCDDITEEDLERLFGHYGNVRRTAVWIRCERGKSKGFGLVELDDDSDTERAIKKLDGKRWRGMNLTVL
jgi:cold-inducible RNA-binding protein